MAEKVTAELRESFGKGAARKLRAAGRIPAVIYGHGTEPVHIALPGHELLLITRRANPVLDITIEGRQQLALVKDVQRDPVRQIIEHIDLLVVRSGERVEVDVPVSVEGETAPGTIVTLDLASVTLDVEATHIPERIEVSVEGAEDGTQVTAADLQLPQGAKLAADPEALVLTVGQPPVADVPDDSAEAAAEGDAAEGDVVPEDDEA